MFKGFREFITRGNVIDLATAVIIGTAFTALVTAITNSVVQPLISRIGASPESEHGFLKIPLGDNIFIDLNAVVTAAINFLIIAAVVYFVIVLPYKKLRELGGSAEAEATELTLLTEIRDLLQESTSVDTGKHASRDVEPARHDTE